MTEFIILSRADMLTLCSDSPVTIYVDKKPYALCTDEFFKKQRNEPQERGETVTLEEAIKVFEEMKHGVFPWYPEIYFDMAIKALMAIEPQESEDEE